MQQLSSPLLAVSPCTLNTAVPASVHNRTSAKHHEQQPTMVVLGAGAGARQPQQLAAQAVQPAAAGVAAAAQPVVLSSSTPVSVAAPVKVTTLVNQGNKQMTSGQSKTHPLALMGRRL
jgi:hypothetical protein